MFGEDVTDPAPGPSPTWEGRTDAGRRGERTRRRDGGDTSAAVAGEVARGPCGEKIGVGALRQHNGGSGQAH